MSNVDPFGPVDRLQQVLDYQLLRHEVLAANVANAETPGYVAKDVVFESALEGEMAPELKQGEEPRIESIPSRGLEEALARISANRLGYESTVEVTQRQLAMLRYGAGDGA